jgi:hypothetical protein
MSHAASQLTLDFAASKKRPRVASGSPRLIIPTCKHILDSGALCRQPAVGGRRFCRAHLLLQVRQRRMARAHRRAGRILLPPLKDLQGVQAGLTQVRKALAAGRIEPKLAGTLRWALQQIASDIRFIERIQGDPHHGAAGLSHRTAAEISLMKSAGCP